MLDKIKEQYHYGKTFQQPEYHVVFRRDPLPQVGHTLYPFGSEYYHELNPVFSFNVLKPDYYNFFRTFTLRDGYVPFASFILKNYQLVPRLNTHFLIHPALAPILPATLKNHFSGWKVVQPKKMQIENAKKIILSSLGSEQTLPTREQLLQNYQFLSKASPEAEVEVFLPTRNNPLTPAWSENYRPYEIVDGLRTLLPRNPMRFIQTKDVLERSSFRDAFSINLTPNLMVTADSTIDFIIASRGGYVHNYEREEDPKAFFEVELSLYHKLQLVPLPDVESVFPDLLFYRKQSGSRDLLQDSDFHSLLMKKGF